MPVLLHTPACFVLCRDPAHVAALEVACLRCLTELVALCWRNKVLPKHLTAIQAVMLDNLRVRDRGKPPASTSWSWCMELCWPVLPYCWYNGAKHSTATGLHRYSCFCRVSLHSVHRDKTKCSNECCCRCYLCCCIAGLSRASEALQPPDTPTTPAAASAGGVVSAAAAAAAESSASSPAGSTAATAIPSVVDTACYQALGIHGAVPSGSNSKQLAGQLLSLMGSFTRDIATVHTILDSFYEYLDERHRWQERGIIRVRVAQAITMCASREGCTRVRRQDEWDVQ